MIELFVKAEKPSRMGVRNRWPLTSRFSPPALSSGAVEGGGGGFGATAAGAGAGAAAPAGGAGPAAGATGGAGCADTTRDAPASPRNSEVAKTNVRSFTRGGPPCPAPFYHAGGRVFKHARGLGPLAAP